MKQGAKYGVIAVIGVLCVTAGVGIGLGVGNMHILNGLEKYEDHKIDGKELLEEYRKWTAISKAEWQDSLKQQKISYINDPSSFLLPYSGESKITAYEYFGFNKELCALARNEIYARYGYQFTKPEYIEAFSNKDWYYPRVSDINEIKLSKEEIFNVTCLNWWADACTIDQTIIKDKDFTDCYYFDMNTPFQIDLDGDGTLEDVAFRGTEDEYDMCHEAWIEINGIKGEVMSGIWQAGITVVDVDPSDSYLELAIYDMGPSSDPVDYYFYYDKGALISMGAASGHLNSETYIKDKVLHAVIRSDVLGTNYYRCNYELTSEHKWKQIPYDLVDVNIPIIANIDIEVYEQRDTTAKSNTCKEGTALLAVQTDMDNWIKVKFEDGHEGWIDKEGLPSWDSLGGLLYCD